MSLLVAQALGLEYPGPLRALEGVDLALEPGELVAVIGPNGSGKSTLLRCFAGLLQPSSGCVFLRGRPLAEVGVRERARELAVVPQFLPELPDVLASDFVLGGRYAHHRRWSGARARDHESVREALAACDAGDLGARRMSELSGGQRQRVLVARAVAQEARVLLVDEPTSALDPEHQLRVFALLGGLAGRGRAALVATHDLNLASQFASRLVLLDAGRVAADGPVERVLRREVLEPVYGPHLFYGRAEDERGARAFVLPWRARANGSD